MNGEFQPPTLEEAIAGLRHEMARGVDYAVVDIAWLRVVLDALEAAETARTEREAEDV